MQSYPGHCEQEKESIIRVSSDPEITGSEGRIEKCVPRDHRLSSLGKPRDAKRRSSGRIFLSYPHTHEGFLYYKTDYHFVI